MNFNRMDVPVHYHRTMTTLPRAARPHRSTRHPLAARVLRPFSAALAVVALGGFLSACLIPPLPGSGTVPCNAPSLISAISIANSTPGGGTLVLTTGCVYTLTSANNATDGGTGLPVITGKVTIQGAGATITRSTASGTPAFRVFDVATNGNLNLNSLTLSNGLANNGQQGGGAIFSHGTLAVTAAPSPTTRLPPPPAPRVGPSTAAGRSR